MANGISALTTRRRERPTGGENWHALSISGTARRSRSIDDRFQRDARGASTAVVRVHHAASIVGGNRKRWFDIVAALAAILLLIPLFCLIALAIKLWDRGPIFYRHRRIGLNGAAFDCLKFRSMVINADEVLTRHLAIDREAAREWEETRKLKRDPRITPLGASMRKTSIDELPQLVNILKGEMSFVGPRPIVTAEVPKYGTCINHYLRARPGLTGPWQVSGRNDVGYSTRVALDRDYVEDWSFWRDVAIIAKTARVVVSARGCY
ncbi:MAG TPA: sugar transferase [Stellaceae bacterium]|nr:sugar transferase [Stellaceae bacterium]